MPERRVDSHLEMKNMEMLTTIINILIVIFYFEIVAFFHAELGSDVCPNVAKPLTTLYKF